MISLWQPWASLVVAGLKQYETRSWKTDWRGPLLIHATVTSPALPADTVAPTRRRLLCPDVLGDFDRLPRGAILGIVMLDDCQPTVQGAKWVGDLSLEERARGNFEPFRYGWRLSQPVKLQSPLQWKGGQGMRNVNDTLRKHVEALLPIGMYQYPPNRGDV